MPNLTDDQLGFKPETTYGTPVTVDRFLPMLPGTKDAYDVRQVQGEGWLVGSQRMERGDRRVLATPQGTVTIAQELQSKGLGTFLQTVCGVGTSALVSGSQYQQVFHPSISGVLLPSATIQMGKVRNDGTVDPYTYAGCTCRSFELDCAEDDRPKLTAEFDALSMATGTALATASYVSAPSLFHSAQGAVLGVGETGTLVVPTSTALASGPGANLKVRSLNLAVDHGIDSSRFRPGGRNQPTAGKLVATAKARVEVTDTLIRAAYLAGLPVPIVYTYTSPEVVAPGNAQFQVVIPQAYITSPDAAVPDPALGQTAIADLEFKVTFDGTNRPFYLVMRTADTTL